MKTIRGQLTRKLLLTIGLLLGIGGVTVYLCTRAGLQAQFDAALRAKAEAIITLTEQDNGKLEFDFSDEHMRGFAVGGNDFFELWKSDGQPLSRSPSLGEKDLPLRSGLPEEMVFWNQTLPGGLPARVAGLQFRPRTSDESSTNAIASVSLVVGSNRHDLDRTLATLGWVLAGGGLVLLAMTGLVVPGVLRRGLSPLQQLADQAAGIDAATLSTRFPTADQPGELAPIASRLNEVLARLEESFERERRFSSNVAHEFRTPLAELRCLAELAIKLPDSRSAATDGEILEITTHLERVTGHLLALSRGERNGVAVQRERVQLRTLIEEVCRGFESKAAERGLVLRWNVRGDGELMSDAALIRCILTNLMDNAVEYTPRGGGVEIEASIEPFAIRVVNGVDDLVEDDLPKLFDRFWRKDPARTPDGHTGLGLPLARTFAQALGCDLMATMNERRSLTMTLVAEKERQNEQNEQNFGKRIL